MKTVEQLLADYERRLKSAMSPRLHVPAKDLKFMIQKIRAAEAMAERESDNEAREAYAKVNPA